MRMHAMTRAGGLRARWTKTVGSATAAVLLGLVLGACRQEPAGTAEEAGKKIDEAVAAAQGSAEEAAEKLRKATEEAAEQAKKAAADVASATREAAEQAKDVAADAAAKVEEAAGEAKEKLEKEKAEK